MQCRKAYTKALPLLIGSCALKNVLQDSKNSRSLSIIVAPTVAVILQHHQIIACCILSMKQQSTNNH
jgi:hypothetical protein